MSDLPSEWITATLLKCCSENPAYGANASAAEYSSELPRYVRITDITDDGRLQADRAKSIQAEGNEKYILRDGDFLFARSGATVGKTYLYREEDGYAVYAGYLIRFRMDDTRLVVEYLKHFTQTFRYKSWVENMLHAGAQPNINAKEFGSLPIPLPPLPEQRKIAAILGTWDEAIATVERLIATLEQRKQGLMQRLLTGAVRFEEFGGSEWREVALGDFLRYTPRKIEKPKSAYLRMGIRSHGKGTFTQVVEDPESNAMDYLYVVKGGDLIINITFAWEQAIALVVPADDGALVSHRFPTYTFRKNVVIPDFFRHLMLTKRFKYQLGLITPGGAGRNRVMSKTDFLKLNVAIPSVMEQEKIGEVLAAANKDITENRRYLDSLKQQKKGLMQRLLTGQVRVGV